MVLSKHTFIFSDFYLIFHRQKNLAETDAIIDQMDSDTVIENRVERTTR